MGYLWLTVVVSSMVALGALAAHCAVRYVEFGKGMDRGEIVLVIPIVGLMATALIAFVLAALGLYKAAPAVVVLLGAAAVLAVARRWISKPVGKRALWAAGALAILSALYWPVADMARGGLDAGVYVNAAALLARYGGIVVKDAGLASLSTDLYNEFFLKLHPDRYLLHHMRFAGFYVLDGGRGLVLPQLFHFYPSLLGLTVSLAGTPIGLKLNAVVGALSVAAFFLAVRRLFDYHTSLLAAAMLAISGVQIWFSRYTTTEITGQMLFFTCLWAVATAHQCSVARTRVALAILGGVAFGEMLLLHPDFPFLLPVVACYGVGLRLTRSWQAWHGWFFGTVAIFTLALAAYIGVYAYPYVGDLYYHIIKFGRSRWSLLLGLGAVAMAALLMVDRLMPKVLPVATARQRELRLMLVAIGCALSALGLYAYLVRPGILQEAFQGRWDQLWAYVGAPVDPGPATTFVRFGWYLSPLGILVALMAFPAIPAQRPRWDRFFWLGFFVVYSLIFLEETYAKSHYIYTMRRYVPIVFPSFVAVLAFAVTALWRLQVSLPIGAFTRGAAAILAVLLLAFFIYTDRPIIAHWEWGGFSAKLDELARQFPANAVILLSDGRDPPQTVATPLWSMYGLETYVIVRDQPDSNGIAGQIDRWQQQGRPIYALLGTNGGKLDLANHSFIPLGQWQLNVKEFEQLFDQKPLNLYQVPLDLGIYRIGAPGQAPSAMDVKIGEMEYAHLVTGFYDRETQGDQVFRWTDGKAILRLEGLRQATHVNLLMSAGPLERPQDATVQVSIDGQPLAKVQVARGPFQWYRLDIPQGLPTLEDAPAAQRTERLLLEISSPTFTMSGLGLSHDSRRLGIQIAQVVLQP